MKLKKDTDSIRMLVLDYFCKLRLDEMGLLNEDFSLKDMTGLVPAVDYALSKEKDRDFQALVHLLSIRIDSSTADPSAISFTPKQNITDSEYRNLVKALYPKNKKR